jgi:hypothetical protein
VYDLWGVCSECVLGSSGAAYWSYFTRMVAEDAYAAFLEQQNIDQKPKHVVNIWSWKDWVILVQFVVIVVL